MNKQIIEILLREGYECELKLVTKGGIQLEGICIKDGNQCCPVIYPERLEETTPEGKARQIIKIVKENSKNINLDWIFDWEKVKEKIALAIRPKVEDEAITMPFLDLELVPYIWLTKEEDENASVKISKAMLKVWDKTAQEVIEQAMKYDYKWTVTNLAARFPTPDFTSAMYVISNNGYYHGAAVLTQVQIFEDIANKFDSDLLIIPSSIHEVIVIPDTGETKILNEMIANTNNECVVPEERLSNHSYIYRRVTKRIEYECLD